MAVNLKQADNGFFFGKDPAFGFVLLLYCSLSSSSIYSQAYNKNQKEVIALSAGAGVLTFHGDVGSNSLVGAYSFIRTGFSGSIEKYFNKNIALSLSLLKGKIARDEKSSDNLPRLNFESPILQAGISGTFLMAGKKDRNIIPFISIGISYLSFDPHGDIRDKNGNSYYYWKDGSIRDLPESGMNYFYSTIINRDYKYETTLGDSIGYSRTSFSLPLSVGMKIKLTSRVDANLGFSYTLAFTDYLDNVKTSGNDAYLYSSASLTWHVFRLPKKEREEVSQLFAEMDKADADNDGILDVNDLCPNNPKGVKVDAKGCPLDTDADGVPDYADKELNSKKGVVVDANGVELTKAKLTEMYKKNNLQAAQRSSVVSSQFNKKPSAEFLKAVEEASKENRSNVSIPEDLKIADVNHDGYISSEEITKTIDSFFDGSINFTVEKMHKLIDFFFEQ